MALTFTVFLIAAHIAFARFEPMLSSKPMADTIIAKGAPTDTFIIYGDQSDGSSVIFYTHKLSSGTAHADRRARNAASTAKAPRCCGARAIPTRPDIDISEDQLSKMWGTGDRKWLFAAGREPDQGRAVAGRPPLSRTIARRQDPLD